MFTILQTWTKVCSKMSQGTCPRKFLVKKDDLGPAVEKQGTVAQTRWRRPATCFIQVCLGNNSHNKLVNTPHRPRLQICCRASLQRQQSWSLWLRLLKPVLGELRDMSKTCSKVGLPAASLASCCHLGGVAGSDDATKKTRGSGRCGPCFHLLQQLLHLDATAAAAPQKKVAMTKV